MDEKTKMIFPETINLEEVSEYVKKFEGVNPGDSITFDLQKTITIHSSFIGFLIHTKHMIDKNGGKLHLVLSYTVERLLIMLNIIDFFSPHVIIAPRKKSA